MPNIFFDIRYIKRKDPVNAKIIITYKTAQLLNGQFRTNKNIELYWTLRKYTICYLNILNIGYSFPRNRKKNSHNQLYFRTRSTNFPAAQEKRRFFSENVLLYSFAKFSQREKNLHKYMQASEILGSKSCTSTCLLYVR